MAEITGENIIRMKTGILLKYKLFIMGIIVCSILLYPFVLRAEITITAIDVGQGDAVLVQHESYVLLIDGGRSRDTVADYLTDKGISHIHLLIATHAHADHIGGLPGVLNRKSVGKVLYNGQTHTTLTLERFIDAVLASDADYHEPGRGESFSFGGMEIQILHPEGSAADYDGHLHDKNIVVRIVYGEFAAIISGDIEHEGELEILDSGHDVSAQVLELGHHGSRTSNHPLWIAAVNPELAFWQAGSDNSYGHPHPETLSTFGDTGINAIGTDTHGTITITAASDGSFRVTTQRKPDAGAVKSLPDSCIDLNTASITELTDIIHIGEARAKKIIEGRPWSSIDELVKIGGMAAGRLQDIQEQGYVCE